MKSSQGACLCALGLMTLAIAGCTAEGEPGLADRVRAFAGGFGEWAPIAYLFAHALLVVLLVPNAPLCVGAGAAFGFPKGWVVGHAAGLLASGIAMALARTLLRSRVERWLAARPALAGVDRALARGGVKLVMLARLSPAIPFAVLNYLYGLTSIPFFRCWAASGVAMLLGTFLYSYAGARAVNLTRGGGAGVWTARVIGVAITVAFLVWITRLARSEVEKSRAAAPPQPPPPPAEVG